MRASLAEATADLRAIEKGARCAMRMLAVAVAVCAALAAQPAADLDQLFHARQWFELRSAVTDRSRALMRAAVATVFNDPETAERLLRNVIKSAPASNDADEAYGMLLQIYLWSGQCGRWVTTYRQWVAAIPSSARARAEEGDEKGLVGQPDQVNSRPRCAVLRHDSGDLTIPVSVDGTVDRCAASRTEALCSNPLLSFRRSRRVAAPRSGN